MKTVSNKFKHIDNLFSVHCKQFNKSKRKVLMHLMIDYMEKSQVDDKYQSFINKLSSKTETTNQNNNDKSITTEPQKELSWKERKALFDKKSESSEVFEGLSEEAKSKLI